MDPNPQQQILTELRESRDGISKAPRAERRSFNGPEVLRLLGRTLAERYEITGHLAGGASGHVFEAIQIPFGRRIALKVLHCEAGSDEARFRKRFRREASIVSQLAHPNIVTVYDFGETADGDVYMAMELVEGRPLWRVLRDDGPFSGSRALHVAIQIARALRRAHHQGVVHRDLKPANILLVPGEDGLDFAKVLDFGLVKLFAPENSEVHDAYTDEALTSVGAMLGTPGYMAPEQAVGEEVDGRTDIYALGVLLFEMLTGRLPFTAESVVELITQQVLKPIPLVRDVAPEADCSPELEAVVLRCLNKRKEDRFATVDELLVALKAAWRNLTDDSFGTESVVIPELMPSPELTTSEAIAHALEPPVDVRDTVLLGDAVEPLSAPFSGTLAVLDGQIESVEVVRSSRMRLGLPILAVLVVAVLAGGAALWARTPTPIRVEPRNERTVEAGITAAPAPAEPLEELPEGDDPALGDEVPADYKENPY